MRVYLIILLILIDSIVSQLLNNESLLVFNKWYNNFESIGLFSAKFEKRLKQIKESDLHFLVQNYGSVPEIDFSLRANLIIWSEHQRHNNSYYDVFYAIPINKR
jgi:hypothetical protein